MSWWPRDSSIALVDCVSSAVRWAGPSGNRRTWTKPSGKCLRVRCHVAFHGYRCWSHVRFDLDTVWNELGCGPQVSSSHFSVIYLTPSPQEEGRRLTHRGRCHVALKRHQWMGLEQHVPKVHINASSVWWSQSLVWLLKLFYLVFTRQPSSCLLVKGRKWRSHVWPR